MRRWFFILHGRTKSAPAAQLQNVFGEAVPKIIFEPIGRDFFSERRYVPRTIAIRPRANDRGRSHYAHPDLKRRALKSSDNTPKTANEAG
jgi:hypothetical protein